MQERLSYKGQCARLFRSQDGKCFYCTREMFLISAGGMHALFATLEHRIPRAKGGTNNKTDNNNFVASCAQCNSVKGDMPEHEFIEMLARHDGDIHSLTLTLFGEVTATKWFEWARLPTPPQPDRTQQIATGKPLADLADRLRAKGSLASPKDYLVHVYSLVTHEAVEEWHYSESNAKNRALAIAWHLVPYLRLACIHVRGPQGIKHF